MPDAVILSQVLWFLSKIPKLKQPTWKCAALEQSLLLWRGPDIQTGLPGKNSGPVVFR